MKSKLILAVAMVLVVACKPSEEESLYTQKEGVYASLSDAVSDASKCHTLIIRNLLPDRTPVSQPEVLSAQVGELQRLKTLKVIGVKGGSIPNEINLLKQLNELEIVWQIERDEPLRIPSLQKNANLSYLKLEDVLLEELPKLPPSIQNLSLKNNKLTKVAEGLARLPNLQSLDLSFNPLGSEPLPAEVLANLRSLNLEHCGLEAFPQEVLSARNLKVLALSGNAIERLPEEIRKLQQLEKLILFNCPISQMPEGLYELKNLKNLWLGCPLAEGELERIKERLPHVSVLVSTYLN